MTSADKTLRIGLVGLDTSHVTGFSKLLNDANHPGHFPSARVVCGFPGGSSDFELSFGRVEGFTRQLRDELDVQILDSPRDVAANSDLVFITAVDGRTHLDYLKQTIEFRKPTFIDKPMAITSRDCEEMLRMARDAGITLVSASSLRFADALVAALQEPGEIIGCDVYGPMTIEPTQPGLFWYGIHLVEIISAVMGTGCRQVRATTNDSFDVIAMEFAGGRIATLRGSRRGHKKYGLTIHRIEGPQYVDLQPTGGRSWYGSLLDALLRTLPRGEHCVDPIATLEIIRIIEAANKSRTTGETVAM